MKMIKIILAFLMATIGVARASYVTGSFQAATGQTNNIIVNFQSIQTPLVFGGSIPYGVWSINTNITATNATLSSTWLAAGGYNMTFGPLKDRVQISVPNDSNTYNVWLLVTNAQTLTNANYPSNFMALSAGSNISITSNGYSYVISSSASGGANVSAADATVSVNTVGNNAYVSATPLGTSITNSIVSTSNGIIAISVTNNNVGSVVLKSNLTVNGALNANLITNVSVFYVTKTIAGNYSISTNDNTIIASSGGLTITLPTAVGIQGKQFSIINNYNSSQTVNSSGGLINGAPSQLIPSQYNFLTVQSDGTNWWVVNGGVTNLLPSVIIGTAVTNNQASVTLGQILSTNIGDTNGNYFGISEPNGTIGIYSSQYGSFPSQISFDGQGDVILNASVSGGAQILENGTLVHSQYYPDYPGSGLYNWASVLFFGSTQPNASHPEIVDFGPGTYPATPGAQASYDFTHGFYNDEAVFTGNSNLYNVRIGARGDIFLNNIWWNFTNISGMSSYTANVGDRRIICNPSTASCQITLPALGSFGNVIATSATEHSWTAGNGKVSSGGPPANEPAYTTIDYTVVNMGSNTANALTVCLADHTWFTNWGSTNIVIPNQTSAHFTTDGTNVIGEFTSLTTNQSGNFYGNFIGNANNLTNIQSSNIVGSFGTNLVGNANGLTNFQPGTTYYMSQFGVSSYDSYIANLSVTNGDTNVWGNPFYNGQPTNFTTNDIGKLICLVDAIQTGSSQLWSNQISTITGWYATNHIGIANMPTNALYPGCFPTVGGFAPSFGCYGYDRTTNLQVAINTCASNGGGTIMIGGLLMVNGTNNTISANSYYGAQLTYPDLGVAQPGIGPTVMLKGASIPTLNNRINGSNLIPSIASLGVIWDINTNTNGCLINDSNPYHPNYTNTNYVVLGRMVYFNTVGAAFEDMVILHSRHNGGIDAQGANSFYMNRCVVSSADSIGYGLTGTYSADTNCFGIKFPVQLQPAEPVIYNVYFSGQYVATYLGERSRIYHGLWLGCSNAISYDYAGAQDSYIITPDIEQCFNALFLTNSAGSTRVPHIWGMNNESVQRIAYAANSYPSFGGGEIILSQGWFATTNADVNNNTPVWTNGFNNGVYMAASGNGNASLWAMAKIGPNYNGTENFDCYVGNSAAFSVHGNQAETAVGSQALNHSYGGVGNTAIGYNALYQTSIYATNSQFGQFNTAIGACSISGFSGANWAGYNLSTSESNNIDIANVGVSNESGVIRIGTPGVQTATYLTGNVSVTNGTLTASNYVGNGAGLTNLQGTNLTGQIIISNNGPNLAMLYGSNMNYLEFVIGNSATNTNATVGLVLSNSNTTLSNWYGEIGYNGSGFSSITNPPGGSNDMYIITQGNNTNGAPSGGTNGNNIWIAAMPTNSSIYFGAGTSGKVFNSGVTSKGVFSSDFSTTNVFAYASNSAVGITNNFGYDVEISYYSGVTNVTLFNPSASLVWGPTTNTGAFSFVLRNGWRLTNASCNYEVTP